MCPRCSLPVDALGRRGGTPQSLSSLYIGLRSAKCTAGLSGSGGGTTGLAPGAELSHAEEAVPGGTSTRGTQTRKPRNSPHTSESVLCGRRSWKLLQI